MRSRAIAAALVIMASGVAGTARASSQARDCGHVITDARGDAQMWFLPTKPYNPEADLLLLDARLNHKSIDFTVTMASVKARPATGTSISIYFTVGQQGPAVHYDAGIDHYIDGNSYGVENQDTNHVVNATGSVDPATRTMRVRVPLRDIGARFGDVLRGLGVIDSQSLGASLANRGFIEQSTGPEYHYRVGDTNNCRPA